MTDKTTRCLPEHFSYSKMLEDIAAKHMAAMKAPRIERASSEAREAYAAGLMRGVSIALRSLRDAGLDLMRETS